MSTRTITGNIKSLTDGAVSSGTVIFEKMVTSTTGNTIHQGGTTTATTDGSGDFSIALSVPASGSYRYKITLPNSDSFYFSIAAGASVNVATLIIAETIEDSDAIVEALAAYLPLSGGTMTGQLNFSGTTHAGIKLLSLTTAQRDALTPANGMVIYNSTTATGQVYQGGAWVSVGGGGAVDSVFGRTGAVVATSGDYGTTLIADNSDYGADNLTVALNAIASDLEAKQQASAKLTAIAALTWAANSIILLTGAATASVQALAAHVVTFLQSASAADARAAIGAGDTTEYIIIALSDETTALTTGTAKATFVMPYAMTLTGVVTTVNTAPTGSAIQVDINEGVSSILSTKLTIDATEKTSATAATPAVISDTALASGAEIILDIDAVGSTIAGTGLKVTLIGTRA